ncbi:MAG: 3-phosphoshikimate 1-carboxyvinyltransferase [Acidobacteria bacterium]|nr:3-phosphoshikimate 1-carboxyvinyltransferase [Acidobacteriota bacterium]
MTAGHSITVRPARGVSGVVRVPGDKSISHRALILSALAAGRSEIVNLAPGDDCRATIDCLRRLGVRFSAAASPGEGDVRLWQVDGVGLAGFRPAPDGLDAQNSGTTARMMMGVLAASAFRTRISGDASLQRRPMQRVVEPLALMGARIDTSDGRLPATVTGAPLRGIDYSTPVSSAQVKSAILLAGLSADGVTTVREPSPTRDHTERAFGTFGVAVESGPGWVAITGGQRPSAARISVPGDPSSAAFWAVAAAALPGSSIDIRDVGLNPTRIGFLQILQRFGAIVSVTELPETDAEPRGTIRVAHRALGAVVVEPGEVPGLIDELPALAALATYGGRLTVTGAAELRVKESDRIAALARGLRSMGADVEEAPDGFHIDGASRLRGGAVDAAGDHRLAMAFAIAALGATGPTTIAGADAVSVSYPGFFDVLEGMCT